MILGSRRSIIAVANEHVPIVVVCRWVGLQVPEIPEGKSVKIRCPFGMVYHPDHGAEPSFRIYPSTESAWCFSCTEFYTPVRLAAQVWDRPQSDVAAELLERIGYKPVSLAQEWDRVSTREVAVDKAYLSVALRTYARRIDPQWEDDQFSPAISGLLDKCLAILDKVTSEDDARTWLDTCKLVLSTKLAGERP